MNYWTSGVRGHTIVNRTRPEGWRSNGKEVIPNMTLMQTVAFVPAPS